jgi:ferredoxin
LTYVITEACIGSKDMSCVEVCPVDCIYEASQMFVIHPEECINCGACLPECPVEAIVTDDDVPPASSRFVAVNAAIIDGPGAVDAAVEAQQTTK